MATVSQLAPGDLVTSAGMFAVFITRTVHPDYPTLMFVVWRFWDAPATLADAWSFDALRPDQEIGQIVSSSIQERVLRLRTVLTGS